jgi:hypothetical protein
LGGSLRNWGPLRITFVLFLVAGISLAAHFYVESQAYYPIVHVEISGAMTVAAVLPRTKNRQACVSASDRYLVPFNTQCKDCKITVKRCARELEGFELALHEGSSLPHPVVVSRETRVAFIGPDGIAQRQCQDAAAHLIANGAKSAACMPPKKVSKKQ